MATETEPVQEQVQEQPQVDSGKQDGGGAPVQTQEQPKTFDPNSLPKEAHEYFSKQYEGHDNLKKMAQEYTTLLRSPDFQSWYNGLKTQGPTPEPEKKLEINEEEYIAALANKDKFVSLVSNLAEQIAAKKLEPQLRETQREVSLSKRRQELDTVIKSNPDFMELDRKGLIEPVLRRYPGLSFDDAYWLAKKSNFNEEVDKRARGLVEKKKVGSIEKPGGPSGQRSGRVVAKSSLEAMEIAAEAFRQGKEIPDIDFE